MNELDTRELERLRDHAARKIRGTVVLFGVAAVILFAVRYYFSVRSWSPLILLAILSLTSIMDAFMYFRCRRLLSRRDHDDAA